MAEACAICSTVDKPKAAEDGTLTCFACSNRILRHLRELEEYVPTLSLEKPYKASGTSEFARPAFGSQSPGNDAVLVHTDPRSDSSDREGNLTDELGAFGVVNSWAQVVMEEHGGHASGFLSACALLRQSHQWITRQPWVDEYADELRKVHTSVRMLASDPIPRSVGRCIAVHSHGECHGQVYELDDASGVRCSMCGRRYSGLDLARFNAAQQEAG